jgi:hypothetical protein
MHVTMVRTTVPMLLVLMLGALSFAGEPPRPPASSAPSVEGTYQLISRQLADGTRLSLPASMGLNTYTKRHRTFHRVLKDATGKFFSSSNVSTYTLTATEYSETRLFSVLDDQIDGKDIVYNLSSETRSAPVTVEGGRIQFKDPFSTRVLVFEGNKMTATAENNANVVDIWEKVE